MNMMLSEIAACVQGKWIGQDVCVDSVSIDTRTLKKDQLYIAICGKNFDGHIFIEQAKRAGASAALVQKAIDDDFPMIIVDDTKLALGQLAATWRNKQKQLSIVGVTGSNGKTTTKEMLASILSVKNDILFTQGNLNNDIGVPLTLLNLQENHRYAVVEMGANHLGEISYTSELVNADVAVITNAGAAHLEGFVDLEGVAKAKGELIETLPSNGIVVLNKEDVYFNYWRNLAGNRKIISFGLHDSDVNAKNIRAATRNQKFATYFELITPQGEISVTLPLAGQHNVLNALAATAACIALKVDLEQIKQGLETLKPVQGRLQLLKGHLGQAVINDTYNANTASLKAGLEVLAHHQGEKWLILGAFSELGSDSANIHAEMGNLIKSYGVTRLWAVGDDTRHTVATFGLGATFFANQTNLINALLQALNHFSDKMADAPTLLVKGSRSQRMENVTHALVENFAIDTHKVKV